MVKPQVYKKVTRADGPIPIALACASCVIATEAPNAIERSNEKADTVKSADILVITKHSAQMNATKNDWKFNAIRSRFVRFPVPTILQNNAFPLAINVDNRRTPYAIVLTPERKNNNYLYKVYLFLISCDIIKPQKNITNL